MRFQFHKHGVCPGILKSLCALNTRGQALGTHTVSSSNDHELIVFARCHGRFNFGHGFSKRQHTPIARQLCAALGGNLVFHVNGGHACCFKLFNGALHAHHIAVTRVGIANERQVDTRGHTPGVTRHQRQINEPHIGSP